MSACPVPNYRGSPALHALRAATGPTHRRLKSELRLAIPGAGRHAYAQYAAAMWGWLQPIETTIWGGGWPAQVDVPARAVKSRWLEEDLERARHDGYLEEEIARRDERFAFRTLAERMGVAYVIECSMLDAQAFRHRLADALFPWPARFLAGYVGDRDRRWQEFLAVLDGHLDRDLRIEDAARSASRAIEGLASWFRAQGAS